MDIHGYPRKNDIHMDMDMDRIFLIHGKPGEGPLDKPDKWSSQGWATATFSIVTY